jgi:hypothetical protein
MTMTRSLILSAVLLALALSVAPSDAADKPKRGRRVDLIWVSPELPNTPIQSIAMFPPVSYEHNLQVENLVAALISQSLKDAGYRWVSAASTRSILQSTDSDSLVRALQMVVLKDGRIDSLVAPALCAKLRTRAILTTRVERWEQQQIEWNQAGRPSTTVQLHASLVDSTGRLLWSASGSETGDGPYHDPNANPIAVTQGQLGTQPVTGQGGPPAYNDVAGRLLARWAAQFPSRAAKAP